LPPIIGGVLCVAAIASLQWLPEAIVDGSGNRMWKTWIWAEILPATLLVYLIVVGKSGPLHSLLNSAPVIYLGRISFGVYLLHWPIVYFMIRTISAVSIISDDLIRATVVFLGTVALTVPIAAILHLVVEKPFMNIGNRIAATERRNTITAGA
jgi:peptidoglycan/LPS O-acetylase OafA/YrhL